MRTYPGNMHSNLIRSVRHNSKDLKKQRLMFARTHQLRVAIEVSVPDGKAHAVVPDDGVLSGVISRRGVRAALRARAERAQGDRIKQVRDPGNDRARCYAAARLPEALRPVTSRKTVPTGSGGFTIRQERPTRENMTCHSSDVDGPLLRLTLSRCSARITRAKQ